MAAAPQAFLSYTRNDDRAHRGAISKLRVELEIQLQTVTGNPDIEIFQDIDGIKFGECWPKVLDEALAAVRFLIPVLSPSFFASPACRDELTKFLAHERNAGREDLILPIYFVSTPVLERPDLRSGDELASTLHQRQRWDWRPYALAPPRSPRVVRAVRQLAEVLAERLATAPRAEDEVEREKRRRANEEVAARRAEEESRRAAQAEAARRKAHEEAEVRRQIEERGRSEEVARRKAEEDAATKRQVEDQERQRAVQAEAARAAEDESRLAEVAKAAPARPTTAGATSRQPGDAFRDLAESWCPEMVEIPAGSFLMGSSDDELSPFLRAGPQHEVRIAAAFALGRYSVTRGEFAMFAESTGREIDGIHVWQEPTGLFSSLRSGKWAEDLRRNWRSPGFAQIDRDPVVGVSWEDASAYCAWLSEKTGERYRLPSEAEWEYACRAGTTTPFWTGATISTDLANYNGNFTYKDGKKSVYRKKTVQVDDPAFGASHFGLYHMHGNVWEWCEDCWHDDYAGAPVDGSAWTSGCAEPLRRVVRGGSWSGTPWVLRSDVRNGYAPDYRVSSTGFRVARTFTPWISTALHWGGPGA